MNLTSILQKTVKKHGNKTAIIEADAGRHVSYSELFKQIEYLSYFLKSNNINQNIKAGIYLKNSSFQTAIFFALLYIGAIPVLIDNEIY